MWPTCIYHPQCCFPKPIEWFFFLKIHTFKVLSSNTILILPEKELFHRCTKRIFVLCTSVPQTTDQTKKRFSTNLLGCFFLEDLCSAWKLPICDYINPFLWDCQCIQVTGEYRNNEYSNTMSTLQGRLRHPLWVRWAWLLLCSLQCWL